MVCGYIIKVGDEIMLVRENYLEEIRGFYNLVLVKILVGIRRCGKPILKNIKLLISMSMQIMI